MAGLREHARALRVVLEVLCAACVVVAVLAAAQGQGWWSVLFVALAFGCYEAGSELE
jgi:hypothetical protein